MITPLRPIDQRSIDWTGTRCNRFLRPLVSRIASLRKLKERKAFVASSNSQTAASNSQFFSQTSSNQKSRARSPSPNSFEPKEKDPDWFNRPAKKKKTSRQYSTRAGPSSKSKAANVGSSLQPGELSIPTPFVSKIAPIEILASNENEHAGNGNVERENGVVGKTVGRPRSGQDDIVNEKFMSNVEDELKLVQGLVKGFLDLMEATNIQTPKRDSRPARGTRSLFSSCLRRIPAWITYEEAYQATQPEEDRSDVTEELYTYLEDTFGMISGKGWIHIREVVRAQGVQLMKTAIEEGLLSEQDTRTVIRHLLKPQRRPNTNPAPAEAGILISALLSANAPSTSSRCCQKNEFYAQTMNSVGFVVRDLEMVSRRAFEFRGFRTLIQSSYVPMEWMATPRIGPLWSNIFHVLLNGSDLEMRDAYAFLEAAVALGTGMQSDSKLAQKVLSDAPARYTQPTDGCQKCPKPAMGTFLARVQQQQQPYNSVMAKSQLYTAFTNTLSSLATILTSFAIASKLAPSENSNSDKILWTLNNLSMDLLARHAQDKRMDNVDAAYSKSKHAARRSAHLLAATLLSQVAGTQFSNGCVGANANELVECIQLLDSAACDDVGIVDSLVDLICSIANGSSRISNAPRLATIQHIVRSMCKAPSCIDLKVSSRFFLRRLALSSAIEYARRNKCSDYQALVREIEKSMSRTERSLAAGTPVQPSKKRVEQVPGYKWEEGICEWVAATPYSKMRPDSDSAIILSSPLPPAPDSDEVSDHGAGAYLSPVASSSYPFQDEDMELSEDDELVSGPAARLSDLLAQSSSPLERSAPVSKLPEPPNRANRKRTWSFDDSATPPDKRRRTQTSISQDSARDAEGEERIRPSKSRRDGVQRAASNHQTHRSRNSNALKRTISARLAIDDSSDDELFAANAASSIPTASRVPKQNNATRRRPTARLLRTFSAPTRPPKRLAPAKYSDDDDELSIL